MSRKRLTRLEALQEKLSERRKRYGEPELPTEPPMGPSRGPLLGRQGPEPEQQQWAPWDLASVNEDARKVLEDLKRSIDTQNPQSYTVALAEARESVQRQTRDALAARTAALQQPVSQWGVSSASTWNGPLPPHTTSSPAGLLSNPLLVGGGGVAPNVWTIAQTQTPHPLSAPHPSTPTFQTDDHQAQLMALWRVMERWAGRTQAGESALTLAARLLTEYAESHPDAVYGAPEEAPPKPYRIKPARVTIYEPELGEEG